MGIIEMEFRASHVEAFRKYLKEDINKDMLIDSLQGTSSPSVKMQIGTHFHELIQTKGATSIYFDDAQLQSAQHKYAYGVYEVKAKKELITKNGVVSISGIADNIIGNIIYEFKTCYGTFSIDKYLDSMQWRLYTWLFDVPAVKYAVYEFPSIATSVSTMSEVNKPLKYKHEHTFTCYANEFDIKDVYALISDLTDFCKHHNLKPITSKQDVVLY
jgi:hypothetical protein